MHTKSKTKSKAISYVICKTFEGEFDPLFGHYQTLRVAERMLKYLKDAANDPATRKSKYAFYFPKPGDDIFVVRSEWTRITPPHRQVRPRLKAA
jgi:hypothetical protein